MDTRERFLSHVLPVTESGCWFWEGHLMRSGYAAFRMDPTPEGRELAHRASYRLFRGGIPEDMIVCHYCDVRCCVNPYHLFLGTYKDNMQDASRKGRMNWKPGEKRQLKIGSRHHSSKITEEDVAAIRASNERGSVLARRYGLTPTTLSKVRRRLLWRHVP